MYWKVQQVCPIIAIELSSAAISGQAKIFCNACIALILPPTPQNHDRHARCDQLHFQGRGHANSQESLNNDRHHMQPVEIPCDVNTN